MIGRLSLERQVFYEPCRRTLVHLCSLSRGKWKLVTQVSAQWAFQRSDVIEHMNKSKFKLLASAKAKAAEQTTASGSLSCPFSLCTKTSQCIYGEHWQYWACTHESLREENFRWEKCFCICAIGLTLAALSSTSTTLQFVASAPTGFGSKASLDKQWANLSMSCLVQSCGILANCICVKNAGNM